jgi:hypothetical protein
MIGFGKDSMVGTLNENVLITDIVTDMIEFYNVDTKEDSFQQIIDLSESKVSQVISFNTSIESTFISGLNSLFYVKNKLKFVKASELEFGDELICPNGESIQYITNVSIIDDVETIIYQLNHQLDDSYGYFINDVLVKNK